MHSDLLTGTDNSKSQVTYQLPVGEQLLPLNELLGQKLSMQYQGEIHCCHCGRKTKKSFNQGFCYPCFKKLPQCDSCIMSPEKCHYHQGTCRDPAWGETFCMTDHVVYLANSSGLKVGITRATQVPTRWIDQGATQAMPFIRVATRQQSGLLEVIFKEFINDRTNWRAMLKGPADPLDLQDTARELLDMNHSRITALQEQFGIQAIQPLVDVKSVDIDSSAVLNIDYPVIEYPAKVTSRSFDKEPLIEGTLLGIKGQYLIFDNGVVNIRKHTAYEVSVAVN
ncbi:DUF2797 domain-containing protein [Endozoicomonas sp. GU-1]|uniref:DUF2797 domain-containing protein n=1 Tax=Endozoicomonas sp. GU-1 TaxID=3009078 RepID=UPI0022B39F78|nr:DUF2797 domain-containing protein [Endozoicomonas sp. GU-1]WBA84059.1 DUF2797 domain-containing protein [Endozoicomonas sp. GU-1]WBA88782.1 DUF2797 domain-containing protein [Endozoicomonas sp. GU-1]